MALVIADRVRETSTTTGTGAVTLAGAYTSFQTFSAAIGNNNSTYYTIANAVTGEWEVGIGTYSSSGNTLSRDTVLASSNSGSLVNFTNGSKDVFVTQPAERSLLVQSAGSGLFTKGAAFTANGILYANATTTLTTSSNLVYDGSNMGLNATPSAWNAAYRALQLGVGASLVGATGASTAYATVGANWYASGSSTYNYLVTAPATYYTQNNGIHYWGVAASGTAGATVAFTAAMALDNSGNLGIGTTSPGYKLDVNGSANISGNIIFSGGTANGVVYLNGSKQVTTGSALTFDGTNLGVGGSAVNGAVYVKAAVNALNLDNSGGNFTIANWSNAGIVKAQQYWDNSALAFGAYSTSNTFFWAGSSEQMRLTSTGLGIGTSSPGAKLDVNGGAQVTGSVSGFGGGELRLGPTTSGAQSAISTQSTGAPQLIFDHRGTSNTGSFLWRNGTGGATTLMTLDSSGNLGLGVTPSAWNTNYGIKAIDISNASFYGATNDANVVNNAYFNSSNQWIYKASLTAQKYTQVGGEHQWFTAPSGTAGNAISFTQAMTLDASGNLGIGTTSVAAAGTTVHVNGSSTDATIRLSNASTGATVNDGFKIQQNSLDTYLVNYESGFMGFYTSGSERMRIDSSGNVGIGTSSPAAKLDLNASGTNAQLAVQNWPMLRAINTTLDIGGYNASQWTQTRLYTNGGIAATLDASGNLGLGVTPSAWGRVAFQRGSSAFFEYGTNNTILSSNYYFDGAANRYLNNGYATYYQQYNGTHSWNLTSSGTAGDPISFTQAMTLDASGNLGIGTTSPISRFDVRAPAGELGRFAITNSGVGYLLIGGGTSTTEGLRLSYNNSDGSSTINNFYNAYLAFATNNTERMRIDSSGNLLVGKTFSSGGTAGIELDPAGLLVATRSGGSAGYFNRLASDGALISLNRSNAEVGTISVTTTATAYNTSSDYRLKDNQAPLTGSGAFIDALQPKTWTWKADGSKGVGFIAHEVQAVSPGSVVGEKDAVDEEGKPKYQAMEYGSAEFIANIIAELQSLRARVAALESKP